MVPINRKKISLYEEAKNGLSSLVWQTATIFVGFIFMLLLTGGNPSSFAITIIFILGIAFVAWREQSRVTKLRIKEPEEPLDNVRQIALAQIKKYRQYRQLQQNAPYDNVRVTVKTTDKFRDDLDKISTQIKKLRQLQQNAPYDNAKISVKEAFGNLKSKWEFNNPKTDIIIMLLAQLQETISMDSTLNDEDKSDALKHVKEIAEIALRTNPKKSQILPVKPSQP